MLYTIADLTKQRARAKGYCLHIRSLRVRRGDRIAVTGPSGCGKSTMLDVLGLALQPDAARVFRFAPQGEEHGTDIMPLWAHKGLDAMADLRLHHMGYVLQTGGLLPFVNVLENMTLTARMNGLAPADARDAVCPLAERLGIAHLLTAMPATLSVGERQRVAIVRALAPRPRLILADEPTAARDALHGARVMEIFLHAVEEQGGTLIMVTHDADFARRGGLREVRFQLEEQEQGVRAVLDDGTDTTAQNAGNGPAVTAAVPAASSNEGACTAANNTAAAREDAPCTD